MRYGGHQTFTIRDGWLYKGLHFLIKEEERWKLVDELAADYLGVGRNMAKAINHWLVATGLARKVRVEGKSGKLVQTKDLEPTDFARMIWKYDRYFLDTRTWWLIHINLVNDPDNAATWNWFFNNFHLNRFQKQVCLQALSRKETLSKGKKPSDNTLERDLSCFLNTYSRDIPTRKKDPEDEIESPLVELGLFNYYRSSGYYQINRDKRDIDFFVFLYAVGKAYEESEDKEGEDVWEIPFFDFINIDNGPGKIFALTNEGLFELLLRYEHNYKGKYLELVGLAGERIIRIPNNPPLKWVKKMYETESRDEYNYG